MSVAALQYVSELLTDTIGIPYAFGEWNGKLPDDRYWTGSTIEPVSMTREESGRQDMTLILRGYARGGYLTLLTDKENIERHISRTAILPDGTGIAIFYAGGDIVPTADSDIKSIKINLDIQEWRVN